MAWRGVRTADPDTSWEAAFSHLSTRAGDRRAALEALYHASDGLTDFELGDLMGRQQTSAGKRRGELRDLGLVCDSKTRRPAPSGSSAIVWVLTDMGIRVRGALTGSSVSR